MFESAPCHDKCLTLNGFIEVNESAFIPGSFNVECDKCATNIASKKNESDAHYLALAHLLFHTQLAMGRIYADAPGRLTV